MRGKFGGLYDVVLAFEGEDGYRIKPGYMNIIRGEKITAHMYIRRIPFENIPETTEEAVKFLYDIYARKVNIFYKNQLTAELVCKLLIYRKSRLLHK